MHQFEDASRERFNSLAELRRVVRDTPTHVLLSAEPHSVHPLHDVARLLAEEARAEDPVRAERLLIALRRAWLALPEARRLGRDAHEELWSRLVTACIEEFYRPTKPPR